MAYKKNKHLSQLEKIMGENSSTAFKNWKETHNSMREKFYEKQEKEKMIREIVERVLSNINIKIEATILKQIKEQLNGLFN